MATTNKAALASRPPHATQADIVDVLPAELVQPYHQLYRLFDKLTQRHLWDYYRAGRILEDLGSALEREGGESAGSRAINLLARALGFNPRTLYQCRRVVQQYSEDEYAELIARQPISWSHVMNLLAVDDRDLRKRLVAESVEQGWSADDLASEVGRQLIKEDREIRPRGPGRSPAVPKNVLQGIDRLIRQSVAYVNSMERAWFCDQFDLAAAIEDASPDTWTDDLRDQVREAADLLREISAASQANARKLSQGLQTIDEVLEQRAADKIAANPADTLPRSRRLGTAGCHGRRPVRNRAVDG